MNITEELILNMGFEHEGTIDTGDKQWYTLYTDGVGFISLTNTKGDNAYMCYFHKNKDEEIFNDISRVVTLNDLMKSISKVITIESIKLGKELKQQEIKNVLSIR